MSAATEQGKFATIVEVAQWRGARQSDRLAYRFLVDGENDEQTITYGDLDRRARSVAAWLAANCAPGGRALLMYPPGIDYIGAFLGTLYAGVVAVPTYPPGRARASRTLERLRGIVADADVSVVLTTAAIERNAARVIDGGAVSAPLRWCATDTIDPGAGDWSPSCLDPESLAFLQYTSGSTGTPKGVMLTHANLMHNSRVICERFGHDDASRGVIWLPPYHDMGLIGGVLQPLYRGFPCTLLAPVAFIQQPLRWLTAISRYGATTSGGPDFAYAECLEQIGDDQLAQLDLSSWQVAFTGAEPIHRGTIDAFARRFAPCGFRKEAFYACYGLAEGTLYVTGGDVRTEPGYLRVDGRALSDRGVAEAAGATDARDLVSSGTPVDDQQLLLIDTQGAALVSDDAVGEVCIAGPSVTRGYWNRPDLNVEMFLDVPGEGRFLRTGDLGFLHQGELYVTGRIKDLIIVRGRNLYPQDIERTIEAAGIGIRASTCAAFSVDGERGERLVVVCETPGRASDARDAERRVRQAVSEAHQVNIDDVVFIRSRTMPKTSSGKVQRHRCRQLYLADDLKRSGRAAHTRDAAAAPAPADVPSHDSDAIAEFLIGLVARLRGLPPAAIDADAALSSQGLDSVEAVRLAGQLEQWLGRPVEPTLIYDYPSIRGMARHLAGAPETAGRVAATSADGDAVAVIGLACRFPGAENAEAFWSLLRDGRDAVREVPGDRWCVDDYYSPEPAARGKVNTRRGGFIRGQDEFDGDLFNVSPLEAPHVDPQQRLLLQVAWEALENAGQAPLGLSGSETGVFVGISSNDHSLLSFADRDRLTAYSGTGNAKSIAANRLSYFFDLHGPSMAVDTACSSSLVAVHLACRSLLADECGLAIAGGVNLMLSPALDIVFSQARMLAPDGRCKTFDDSADGYVRGEGCGAVILKRLSDAQRQGDTVLAVIRGSSVNQDGRSNGLTAPNGPAQEAVIGRALKSAGVEPAAVGLIEAHGTGTRLGDPIEYQALTHVLQRPADAAPCLLGSVKTNIGHLEAAAGIAGLIKVVLALRHATIPAHLHFTTLNAQIRSPAPWLCIPTRSQAWQPIAGRRLAGVSSFGFGGTNAHLVLEEAPPREDAPDVASDEPRLLALSAHNAWSLKELAGRYARMLADGSGPASLDAICRTAALGRSHLSHRLAVVARDLDGLRDRLAALAGEPETAPVFARPATGGGRRVVFLFPGQGAQYAGMGRELYRTEPVFRDAIDRCDAILRPLLDRRLTDLLFADDGDAGRIDGTGYAQPALFSLEYALAQLWMALGVRPDIVLGHSAGEYVAACIAGVFDLEQGLRLIAARAGLMQSIGRAGGMLAVFAGTDAVDGFVARDPGRVSVAAINAPALTTLAGDDDALAAIATELRRRGIGSRRLACSHAFHSAHVDTVADAFARVVGDMTFAPPQLTLISNLTGAPFGAGDGPDADYWIKHMRLPVRFLDGVRAAVGGGGGVFLEVGPGAGLTGMARHGMDAGGRDAVLTASLERGKDARTSLLDAVAALYTQGATIDWTALFRTAGARTVALPTLPFRARPVPSGPARGGEENPRPAGAKASSVLPFRDSGRARRQTHTDPQVRPMQLTDESSVRALRPDTAANPAATLSDLRELISGLLHIAPGEIDDHAPFLEMGADSLVLMDAIHGIESRFGVKLSINQMFEETPDIARLAAYIDAQRPAPATEQLVALAGRGGVEDIVQTQLRIMARQLSLLTGDVGPAPAAAGGDLPSVPVAHVESGWGEVAADAVGVSVPLPSWFRNPVSRDEEQDTLRDRHVRALTESYTARTPTSKRLAQRYRAHLADNRASAGFRLSTKEMLYPLVGERATGSRLWDVDGNEYIDFTMGFGAYLFGHSPAFIVDALREQLDRGMQLGPQTQLAGEVADRLCRMTGHDRAAFCNSGTEAVMTAVRLARAVTGRDKIALFTGSYHGTFDGFLGRSQVKEGRLHTEPVAPGVPRSILENDLLVLDYGRPESLELLKRHARQLAAVVVEPVQSRNPELQPLEFLRELRALTAEAGIALIWDEVISGFRVAPGGAQELFGIRADIATYGKVIGGGMPIGVIAGRREYLDAVDGGAWDYGDESYPRVPLTFFAGTFNKHPMTMRGALAVLDELEARGPALQAELNARTAALVNALNDDFAADDVPLRLAGFGSLFRFAYQGNLDLLFFHLMEKGIYIWEGRNCFLSTAHSDADVARFADAVKESVADLRRGGYIAGRGKPGRAVAHPRAALAVIESQERFLELATGPDGAPLACNINFGLRLAFACDADRLQRAFNRVIERHEALRARFDTARRTQSFLTRAHLDIGFADLSELPPHARARRMDALMRETTDRPFDPGVAPLLRVDLYKLDREVHALVVVAHHLVCDGWSLNILLNEVIDLYRAEVRGETAELPVPLQFSDYARQLGARLAAPDMARSERYWLEKLPGVLAARRSAGLRSSAYRGARIGDRLDRDATAALKKQSARNGSTLFMALLALYKTQLLRLTDSERIVVGIPVAARDVPDSEYMVGNCVNLLPIVTAASGGQRLSAYLSDVRATLLEAYGHMDYPYMRLLKRARAIDGGQIDALFDYTFNLEPNQTWPQSPDTPVGALRCPVAAVEFPVMLNAMETDDGLQIDLDFREDALDEDAARALLDGYLGLLAALARGETGMPVVPAVSGDDADESPRPGRLGTADAAARVLE